MKVHLTKHVMSQLQRKTQRADRDVKAHAQAVGDLLHVSAETWAKLLWEATGVYRAEPVDWKNADPKDKASYRTMGAAVAGENRRRILSSWRTYGLGSENRPNLVDLDRGADLGDGSDRPRECDRSA